MVRILIKPAEKMAFDLCQAVQRAFPDVRILDDEGPDNQADLVLAPFGSGVPSGRVVLYSPVSLDGQDEVFVLPGEWELMKEEIRARLALSGGLGERNPQSFAELPALGDELFTLGGLSLRQSELSGQKEDSEPDLEEEDSGYPVEMPSLSVQNTLDSMQEQEVLSDELFNLGFSETGAVANSPAEQVTAPGILRRNTMVADIRDPVEEPEGIFPADTQEPAQAFLRAWKTRMTGVMELSLSHHRIRLAWESGMMGDVDGIGPILQHLLQLSGASVTLTGDLTRTLSDPLELALKRKLILPEEELTWLARCRKEAFILALSEKKGPVMVENVEFSRKLPLLDPRPLLFRGIVETMAPDAACAWCDCAFPEQVAKPEWNPLFSDTEFDPLWVRAIRLFADTGQWMESSIRAGLSQGESWTLAYASRLFDLCEPRLPKEVPAAEILRRRFRNLEESFRTGPNASFFGDNPIAARRVHQEILVQLSSLPTPLQVLLALDIEKLKKSMDKALSLLSF